MKIIDLWTGMRKPTVSFELFPARSEKGAANLEPPSADPGRGDPRGHPGEIDDESRPPRGPPLHMHTPFVFFNYYGV